jgi:RimJ/RimL family protein N-acetyltransferase
MSLRPIAITTPTLLLRPFRRADAARFAAAVRESAASVGRWMPWPRADYTPDMALAWFADCAAQRRAGSALEFGIFSRDWRTLLGGAGLNRIDAQHRSANLGYWVRHAREGRASPRRRRARCWAWASIRCTWRASRSWWHKATPPVRRWRARPGPRWNASRAIA